MEYSWQHACLGLMKTRRGESHRGDHWVENMMHDEEKIWSCERGDVKGKLHGPIKRRNIDLGMRLSGFGL